MGRVENELLQEVKIRRITEGKVTLKYCQTGTPTAC